MIFLPSFPQKVALRYYYFLSIRTENLIAALQTPWIFKDSRNVAEMICMALV